VAADWVLVVLVVIAVLDVVAFCAVVLVEFPDVLVVVFCRVVVVVLVVVFC
jgi:hypothetical protein